MPKSRGLEPDAELDDLLELFLNLPHPDYPLYQLIDGYIRYVGRVLSQTPGSTTTFDTRFLAQPNETWVHGWDHVLAAVQAVSIVSRRDPVRVVKSFTFCQPTLGNMRVQVLGGEVPKPDGALMDARIITEAKRVFSVHAVPNGKPLREWREDEYPESFLASAAVVGFRREFSPNQPLDYVPPFVFDEFDFS